MTSLPGLICAGVAAASLFAAPPHDGSAEEFVLRAETVGYLDVLADEEPKSTVLNAIELPIRLGVPFEATSSIGDQTIRIRGRCAPGESGRLSVRVMYSVERDTGLTIPTETGEEKVLSRSSIDTTIDVEPGSFASLGGWETKSVSTTPRGTETRVSRMLRQIRVRRAAAVVPLVP